MTTLAVPVLPLKDVIVFPHMVIPLFIGRLPSIRALDEAMATTKQVVLLAQKKVSEEDPSFKNLHKTGTLATILQMLKLPDGTLKVLVEGNQRCQVIDWIKKDKQIEAEIETLEDIEIASSQEIEALVRTLLADFETYVRLNRKIPTEIIPAIHSIDNYGRLSDTIAAHIPLRIEEKQKILEALDIKKRLLLVLKTLGSETDIIKAEKRIQGRVKREMEKGQREYYLSEKLKAIQKELGDSKGEGFTELGALEKAIHEVGMTKEAQEKALSELSKLKMMPPMSAEATVSRNYLDCLVKLPWKKESKLNLDLNIAEKTLNADHYGLEKIKERILEFLAVQQRVDELEKEEKSNKTKINRKAKGSILCLVGPPGVGKTSLGLSIANATGREFLRMALGGVRDEAEIRGHRRTYIGSLPGKIIQKISKVGVRNPLFMLDEIDKLVMDFRGDPASALLEVLDPEQNHAFSDHYLEVDYDLSHVMFIATANSLNIPHALLDRMEIIRIPGYTEEEKIKIAENYLVADQIERNGLRPSELAISHNAIKEIVRYYTREAGVRNLDRAIAKLCRKVVKEMLLKRNKKRKLTISAGKIEKYLGVRQYRYGLADLSNQIGIVTALAWTEVGGELLKIESVALPGKGNSPLCTGQLGDVMQESIKAALTVVRSRAKLLGIPEDFYEHHDIHVHVPEGATPKDGPSAGIAMCTALVSSLTKIPVRADVAMTGEITLRGQVLPIGGLKEKLLAALLGGIKTVIIPLDNAKDLKEMPKNITQHLEIKPVEWIDQVLAIALSEVPKSLKSSATKKKASKKKPLPQKSLLPKLKQSSSVHP